LRPLTEIEEKKFATLKLLALVMLIIAPVLYALVGVSVKLGNKSIEGANDMLTYILIIVSLLIPLAMNLVVKVQKNTYRNNRSSRMTSADIIFTIQIQKYAFAEAIFIFGLMAVFTTGDTIRLWWFYPIGAVMTFYVWPRRQKFEELIEELERP